MNPDQKKLKPLTEEDLRAALEKGREAVKAIELKRQLEYKTSIGI